MKCSPQVAYPEFMLQSLQPSSVSLSCNHNKIRKGSKAKIKSKINPLVLITRDIKLRKMLELYCFLPFLSFLCFATIN